MRTAEQISYDERTDIVGSWLCSGDVSDKSQWVMVMARVLGVQQDTIRLVLAEEGWA